MAACRAAIGGDLPLILAMATAGLLGGVVHCAGMCGPFVLGQVAAGLEQDEATPAGEWGRFRSGALIPYHLGRLTTYAGLGALAAGAAGWIGDFVALRWLSASLLALAAALFLGQAAGFSRVARGIGPLGRAISGWGRPLLVAPSAGRRYLLGVVLGFLPCGLLYAALAAAAASDTVIAGAAAMAAFALGTVPALIAVGYAGQYFGRRWRASLRPFATALLAVNAVVLLVLAWFAAP